jgi:FkbM family methyltransferase
MHNGDDTEYYLLKGADVVGIEANPALLPGLQHRFADEISAQRLTLINKAVGPEEKLVPFYVTPGHARQSSMVRKRAGFSKIEVQAVRLSSLMNVYGVPDFAKIDVEHVNGAVLDDLDHSGMVPPNLSVEVETFEIFFKLYAMGFTQFRLINCKHVSERFKDHPVSTFDGTVISHAFPHQSSGPFGDDLPQPWQTLEQVCAQWISRDSLFGRGWYDVHAASRQT